jgi:hypothetical protein
MVMKRKQIGLGICAWDEITPNNLARFSTSIKYLIISLALLSSGIMADAGYFGYYIIMKDKIALLY